MTELPAKDEYKQIAAKLELPSKSIIDHAETADL